MRKVTIGEKNIARRPVTRNNYLNRRYEQFIKTVARGNDQQLMNYLKMDEDKTRI